MVAQDQLFGGVTRAAQFSPCHRYRYRLEIRWGDGKPLNFLMLNPSTADEFANDPTVERCQRRAERWGYQALVVTNLFAWRDTDPKLMKQSAEPVGPDNDEHIKLAHAESRITVAAWGKDGAHLNRASQVRAMLQPLYYLKMTTQPWHPLYLPYDLEPKLWT